MKNALCNIKFIKSKRQPKSLEKILTSAKFDTSNNKATVSRCNHPRCGICSNLIEGDTFTFKNGQTFKVKNGFDCTSENLIYVITCPGCTENYIGQTGMTLRQRMTVHRQ